MHYDDAERSCPVLLRDVAVNRYTLIRLLMTNIWLFPFWGQDGISIGTSIFLFVIGRREAKNVVNSLQ